MAGLTLNKTHKDHMRSLRKLYKKVSNELLEHTYQYLKYDIEKSQMKLDVIIEEINLRNESKTAPSAEKEYQP